MDLGFPNSQCILGNTLLDEGETKKGIELLDKALAQGYVEAALVKGEYFRFQSRFQEAIEAYSIYVVAPLVERPEMKLKIQFRICECLIASAEDDISELKYALKYMLGTLRDRKNSASDLKIASDIVKPALKKLKGRLPYTDDDSDVELLLGFRKDGTIREFSEFMELTDEIAKDYTALSRLPKDIYPLADLSHRTKRVQKKPGRNDPCTCNSGKKYKNCCGSGSKAPFSS